MAEIIYLGGNYMLENWIKPQIPEEEELDERLHAARSKLSVLQMQIKEHGLPVLVCLRAGVLQERAVCSVR